MKKIIYSVVFFLAILSATAFSASVILEPGITNLPPQGQMRQFHSLLTNSSVVVSSTSKAIRLENVTGILLSVKAESSAGTPKYLIGLQTSPDIESSNFRDVANPITSPIFDTVNSEIYQDYLINTANLSTYLRFKITLLSGDGGDDVFNINFQLLYGNVSNTITTTAGGTTLVSVVGPVDVSGSSVNAAVSGTVDVGNVVDVSGSNVNATVSGTVDVGNVVDVSGSTVDASGSNVNATVSGTVDIGNVVDVSGSTVDASGSNVNATVDGTVNAVQSGDWYIESINNAVSVTGSVTANQGGTWTVDASGSNVNASISGTVGVSGTVDVSGSTVDASGSNVSAAVSGTVDVGNVVDVTGSSVSISSGSVTATVDGTVNSIQSGSWAVDASGSNVNATVSGTVDIGNTVDVSGSTVDASGSNVNAAVSGTVDIGNTVDVSGSNVNATVSGSVNATVDGTVSVSGGTIDTITNTVNVSQQGTVVVSTNGVPIDVQGTLDVGDITITGDTTVVQNTHDNFNSNANIQVGNADVGSGNPVPVSDNDTSLTVDGTVGVSGTVDVSGSTVDASGSNVNATVTGTVDIGNVVDVSGSNVNATVSGSVNATVDGTVSISGGNIDANVSGTVDASQSGTWNIGTVDTITNTVGVSGSVDATQSGTWDIGTVSTITNAVAVTDNNSSLTVDGTVAITAPVSISGTITTTGDSTIMNGAANPVPVIQAVLAGSTYAPSSVISFGTAGLANVKASPGNVLSFTVDSTASVTRYILLHNKSTAPVGTDIPVFSFRVPSESQIVIGADFFTNAGAYFSNGIGYCWSSTRNVCTAATSAEKMIMIQYK